MKIPDMSTLASSGNTDRLGIHSFSIAFCISSVPHTDCAHVAVLDCLLFGSRHKVMDYLAFPR
jgi:hypothetical protein